MKKLLNILNAEFPELLAVDASEFDNTYEIGTAIWFRGSEDGKHPMVYHYLIITWNLASMPKPTESTPNYIIF